MLTDFKIGKNYPTWSATSDTCLRSLHVGQTGQKKYGRFAICTMKA